MVAERPSDQNAATEMCEKDFQMDLHPNLSFEKDLHYSLSFQGGFEKDLKMDFNSDLSFKSCF